MRMLLMAELRDIYKRIRYGPRCDRHPGHYQRENKRNGFTWCSACYGEVLQAELQAEARRTDAQREAVVAELAKIHSRNG